LFLEIPSKIGATKISLNPKILKDMKNRKYHSRINETTFDLFQILLSYMFLKEQKKRLENTTL